MALNRTFEEGYGIATIKVDMLAIAEAKGPGGRDRVLTERVDRLLRGQVCVEGVGHHVGAVHGVFEVEGDRIVASSFT